MADLPALIDQAEARGLVTFSVRPKGDRGGSWEATATGSGWRGGAGCGTARSASEALRIALERALAPAPSAIRSRAPVSQIDSASVSDAPLTEDDLIG